MVHPHRSLTQIFGTPAVISIIVAFGLVSALLGDGVWDATSWVALLVPLLAIVFFIARKAS